jgi:dephospho-CoA kinase
MAVSILPHIAFIGRAGAGKTTAAELLVKGFGYERLSFAAPLKVACGTTTDRSLLQAVGAGVRDLHEDFWVNLLIDELYNRNNHAKFVIDDCRYPNEAARLALEGFVIVRIAAKRIDRIPRLQAIGKLQDEAQLEHASETALDAYEPHYTIDNSGTSEDLLRNLTYILNKEQR